VSRTCFYQLLPVLSYSATGGRFLCENWCYSFAKVCQKWLMPSCIPLRWGGLCRYNCAKFVINILKQRNKMNVDTRQRNGVFMPFIAKYRHRFVFAFHWSSHWYGTSEVFCEILRAKTQSYFNMGLRTGLRLCF